jgi:hypothetical protein
VEARRAARWTSGSAGPRGSLRGIVRGGGAWWSGEGRRGAGRQLPLRNKTSGFDKLKALPMSSLFWRRRQHANSKMNTRQLIGAEQTEISLLSPLPSSRSDVVWRRILLSIGSLCGKGRMRYGGSKAVASAAERREDGGRRCGRSGCGATRRGPRPRRQRRRAGTGCS